MRRTRAHKRTPPSFLSPTLNVEITSDSTFRVDKRDKLGAYRQIETIPEYWTVDIKERRALQFIKGEDWNLRIHGIDAVICSDNIAS